MELAFENLLECGTTASNFAGWKIASILWLSANILSRNIAATLTM